MCRTAQVFQGTDEGPRYFAGPRCFPRYLRREGGGEEGGFLERKQGRGDRASQSSRRWLSEEGAWGGIWDRGGAIAAARRTTRFSNAIGQRALVTQIAEACEGRTRRRKGGVEGDSIRRASPPPGRDVDCTYLQHCSHIMLLEGKKKRELSHSGEDCYYFQLDQAAGWQKGAHREGH